MSSHRGVIAFIVFITVILAGGVIYSKLEGWNFLDSIYFSAVTITTLGYGDLVPKTNAGKIFTILFSISGIAIGLYILSLIGKNIFAFELHRKAKINTIKHGHKFDVTKLNVGTNISWVHTKKEFSLGVITEIGFDYIKIMVEEKNGRLIPKKDQKVIIIGSDGKLRK